MAKTCRSLGFTETFLETFVSKDLTAADSSAILKALRLLDEDERHRSLRVHELEGTARAPGQRRRAQLSGSPSNGWKEAGRDCSRAPSITTADDLEPPGLSPPWRDSR